jgi:hypothetical protein
VAELAGNWPIHPTACWLPNNGALVGTVSITRRNDDVAYLGMLAVDPAQQAGGLAAC